MDSSRGRPPANVKLVSSSGRSLVNVNIHNIHGSVTVGNSNTITYYHPPGRGRQHVPGAVSYFEEWDSHSDSSTSSSDDSEAERFFAAQGFQKPSKKMFRDSMQTIKNMEKANFSGVNADFVHTLIIDPSKPSQQPAAYDRNGQPVPVFQTTAPAGRPSVNVTTGFRATPSQHPTHPEPKQASAACLVTKYDQQTQRFNTMSREIRQPQKTVDEDLIQKLSPHFGQGWRRVFRHLNIPDSDIDLTFQNQGEVKETVQKLLVEWRRQCDAPNIITLAEALVRSEQYPALEILKNC